MEVLEQDWLTKGLMDFEYKKYILLAYLQKVKENFNDLKLYPFLSDLAFHYKNLIQLKSNKSLIYRNFPKEITKAEFKKLKFHYKKLVEDSQLMELIEQILNFAMPEMEGLMEEGKDIYENVEENVSIESVGITPLYNQEGYFFLNQTFAKETKIFQYQITVFESANEKYRGINTVFVKDVKNKIGRSFEQIKLELVKTRKELPNPATFLINVDIYCPLKETVMPIAKRLLVKHLSVAA